MSIPVSLSTDNFSGRACSPPFDRLLLGTRFWGCWWTFPICSSSFFKKVEFWRGTQWWQSQLTSLQALYTVKSRTQLSHFTYLVSTPNRNRPVAPRVPISAESCFPAKVELGTRSAGFRGDWKLVSTFVLPSPGEHESTKSAFLHLYIHPIELKFTGFTRLYCAEIISEIQLETPNGVEKVRSVRFLVKTGKRPSSTIQFLLDLLLKSAPLDTRPRHLYRWKEHFWHIKMAFVSFQYLQ